MNNTSEVTEVNQKNSECFYEEKNPLLFSDFFNWKDFFNGFANKTIIDPFSKTDQLEKYLNKIDNNEKKWKYYKVNSDTIQSFLFPKNEIIISNILQFEKELNNEKKLIEILNDLLKSNDYVALIAPLNLNIASNKTRLYSAIKIANLVNEDNDEIGLFLFIPEKKQENLNIKQENSLNLEEIIKPDYELHLEEQRKKNRLDFIEMVKRDDEEFKTKIATIADRIGMNKEYLACCLKDENFLYEFATFFAVNPTKQNIYEKRAEEVLTKIPEVENFKKLPQNGKNALFIYKGRIINNRKIVDIKAIDFYFEFNGKKYYICHKYTRLNGGAQDHQKAEGVRFLLNGKECKDKNIMFVFLCDGEYYQQVKDGIKVIDAINLEVDAENAIALTTEELQLRLISERKE